MRVIIADENAGVRSALRLLLEEIPNISVLAEASTCGKLLGQAEKSCPDLILIDVELPGLPLEELVENIKSICSGVAIIGLSSSPQMQKVAFEAGIFDFVCKSDPPESLLGALDKFYRFNE
jgi:DNA-binding NarL/FixJ family response regulator